MIKKVTSNSILLAVLFIASVTWTEAEGQRMSHSASGRYASKPSESMSKSINGGSVKYHLRAHIQVMFHKLPLISQMRV